jgi:hypothetical protein
MINDKINEIFTKLLDMFASGELPPAIARTVIQRQQGDNKPSDRWSFSNQLLMIIAGTSDARGFRQWQQANRTVKKGAKACRGAADTSGSYGALINKGLLGMSVKLPIIGLIGRIKYE